MSPPGTNQDSSHNTNPTTHTLNTKAVVILSDLPYTGLIVYKLTMLLHLPLFSSNYIQKCEKYLLPKKVMNGVGFQNHYMPFHFQNLERPAACTNLVAKFGSSCSMPAVICAFRLTLGF